MKKFLLFLVTMCTMAVYGQTIQVFDFESAFPGKWGTNGNPNSLVGFEDNVNFSIVENPSKSGINTSAKVGKFHRLKSGLWWALAWFETPPVTIKAGETKYLHLSIYKPLASTVCVQLKDKVSGDGIVSTAEFTTLGQTKVNEWQELVFPITNRPANPGDRTYYVLEIKPDFVNPSAATGDIDIYFDNIYVNDDPFPVGGDKYEGDLPENFEGEYTLLNPVSFFGDKFASIFQPVLNTDLSVVNNPSKTGINPSPKCGKFIRKKDGNWWAGFFMQPKTPLVANAENKYLHVMFYKTIQSPITLKLENGTPNENSGDIIVTPGAEDVGKWVDYVFEVPASKYGTYGKVTFFPDFVDQPVGERLSEDLEIYFDNLVFNNDPNPIEPVKDIVIQDFESGFSGRWGTNGNPANQGGFIDHENFSIEDNPSKSGINTSAKAGKFHRLKSGLWWALAWFDIVPFTIGAGETKYLHISVYKPIVSTVCIQLKDKVPGPTLSTAEFQNSTQTKVNEWQELVFEIKNPNTNPGAGTYNVIEVKPDFINSPPSGRLDNDIDIYFDNIYVNDDPNPKTGTVDIKVPEDTGVKAWIGADGDIHIDNQVSSARAKLYSINGILLHDAPIPVGASKITPPSKQAIYILRVNEKVFKLLR